ncbi:MAG: nitronate monooxygenase [Lachnospira sp.]|nr:nitronate monooxygenase [Lachnospira sp.]
MKQLAFGDKTISRPIIQGGMGVGISLGNLAGAVAKEGGVGIISTAQIGFREPDFYDCPMDANIRAIPLEFQKARAIAPKGVIGFNIMVALNGYKECCEAAVLAGADVIISGAGLPTELPKYVEGSKTLIAPIVSSKKSASVILKLWHRKYKRTADFLVIEGPMAGGHLGFSKESMEEYLENGYDDYYENEIRDIIAVVREYEDRYQHKIPVFVAGGMGQYEDLERMRSLGADGIQVATRFVTTKECDAPEAYKERYLDSKRDDIKIVSSPVGMPGRAIVNFFMEQVLEGKKFPPKRCLNCLKKCNPAEIPYCISQRLIMAASGQVEQGLLFCGANAYQEQELTTVGEVMRELCGENR